MSVPFCPSLADGDDTKPCWGDGMGTNWAMTICDNTGWGSIPHTDLGGRRWLVGRVIETMQRAQPSWGSAVTRAVSQLQRPLWEVRAYLFEVQGTRSAAGRQGPLAFCYLWTSAIGFWNYSVHWLWQGNGSCKYTLVHSARSFTTKVTRVNNSGLPPSPDVAACFSNPSTPGHQLSPRGFSTNQPERLGLGWWFNPFFF